jgi:hypothetical protein
VPGVEVRVDALPITAMVNLDRVIEALREQQNALSAKMEFIRPSQAGAFGYIQTVFIIML